MKLLCYREDRRSVLFVFLCLGLLLLPFGLVLPPGVTVLWLLLSSLFCFCACVINHNHIHSPVFCRPVLNSLLGIVLSLAKGHTSAGVIVAHNYNHHVHNGSGGDWINPQLAGSGPGVIRLLRFVVVAVLTMARGRKQAGCGMLDPAVYRQLHLERAILLFFVAVLVVVDARDFMLYVAIPWLVGVVFLVGVNLLQHDHCDPQSMYDHSRNFKSRLGNWFFFNNGYHTVHHMQPGLHWSLLPARHENEVAPNIAKQLEQNSVLAFLLKNYLAAK